MSDFDVFLLVVMPVDGSGQHFAAAPVREQKERLLNVNIRSSTEVTVISAINFNNLEKNTHNVTDFVIIGCNC